MPVLVCKIDIYYEVMPVLAYNLNTGGTQKFVPEASMNFITGVVSVLVYIIDVMMLPVLAYKLL